MGGELGDLGETMLEEAAEKVARDSLSATQLGMSGEEINYCSRIWDLCRIPRPETGLGMTAGGRRKLLDDWTISY